MIQLHLQKKCFLNESLQIAFPNNVLISKFQMNAAKVNSLSVSTPKRGAESAELINI